MMSYTEAMHTTTAYRLQDADRDLSDLVDPEQQYSFPMSGEDEDVRHGVSGCLTLGDLAAYIATHAIEMDVPVDGDHGEVLILPVRAERIEDDEKFFDLVSDLVDMYWEQGLDCAALRDVAADRI